MDAGVFLGPELASLSPELQSRLGQILGDPQDSPLPRELGSLLSRLPPRARFIGPESWLDALRRQGLSH